MGGRRLTLREQVVGLAFWVQLDTFSEVKDDRLLSFMSKA